MLSYNDDPGFASRFRAEMREHSEQDHLMRTSYGEECSDGVWRGCAIGCAVRSLDRLAGDYGREIWDYDDHALVAERLGIPHQITHVVDRIFEYLPLPLAMEWPCRFADSLPVGKDLKLLWPRLAVWLLTDPVHGVTRHAMDAAEAQSIAALYERRIAGDEPTRSEWWVAGTEDATAAAYARDAAFDGETRYAGAAAFAAAQCSMSPADWYRACADKLIALFDDQIGYATHATHAAYAAYAALAARAAASIQCSVSPADWYAACADKLITLMERA